MIKKLLWLSPILALTLGSKAQTNPIITSWLQNTTTIGSNYTSGNSTAISNNIVANVQKVSYSTNFVYINTHGVPSYPTGPFLDGNPSVPQDQNAILKFPLTPTQNTGTATATSGGNIGIFIDGVAMFDYRDGVAWNTSTNSYCGGPGNSPCPGGPTTTQAWNRDAVVFEKGGFDCAKGHPAMGNYHHHQNPSAFKLDNTVISTICNLYDSDGLYVMDSTKHSPLLGFAYDGYPVYGAYGYKNTDGTGGISRIKSGYSLRNITTRTTHADGNTVSAGPVVSSTYPLGTFREDYEFIAHTSGDYLDAHNGRFCITPEYPNGTYAYFCTVDANLNSAYPYIIGPTYYGIVSAAKVSSISETTTTYVPSPNAISNTAFENMNIAVFPNPNSEFLAIQVQDLLRENISIEMVDVLGKKVANTTIFKGQTVVFLDTRKLYNGLYLIKLTSEDNNQKTFKVEIKH